MQAAGGAARNAHGLLGWVLLAPVLIHIAAALRRHFLPRDTVLARMLPGLRAPGWHRVERVPTLVAALRPQRRSAVR